LPYETLATLAGELGSDVPFFVQGGTALAGGRGETLKGLVDQADCQVVLINPGFAVSTAEVYGGVTSEHFSNGSESDRFAMLPPGASLSSWHLVNALQAVTVRLHPAVRQILDALDCWGAVRSLMCGSGPTCFGLFGSADQAQAAATNAEARGWHAWVTHFA
jgi:4-diphosphocytidyl-2-C-methyl-D-erythritol kinase